MDNAESSSQETGCTHVLQTTGILKNFSVAKLVTAQELRDLKSMLRDIAESDAEYEEMLKEEMDKLANFGGANDPIPGIIFFNDSAQLTRMGPALDSISAAVRKLNLSKENLGLFILALMDEVGIEQADLDDIYEANGEGPDDDDMEEA